MKKTHKRISALLLAVCLVLSVMVPAVWAEGTDATEAESVVYNFDYYSAIAPTTPSWNLDGTAWMYMEYTDKAGVENPTANKEQLDALYSEGALNWKLADFKSTYTQGKLRVASFVAPNTGKNEQNYGYFRLGAKTGDWVAFTIKNPGANIQHTIKMKYTTYSYAASVCSVYILPADTQDIGAALATAEKIGSVNLENSTQASETPNIPAETALLGMWTPGDAEEYIVVLEATEGSVGKAGWGYLYLSELTMDAMPKAEVKEDVIYNFDYYDTVAAPGNDVDGSAWLVDKNGNTALDAEIEGKYADGALNWDYLDGVYTYEGKDKARFLKEGYTEKTNTAQDGFLVVRGKVGDWIAFTIKNPGAGTKRTVSITHPTSKYGAGSSNIYILPSDTKDIAAAIASAEPIGSVGFYNSTVASCEVPAIAMSTSSVGVWTPGDAEEYIFVMEATEADATPGVAPWAYMYISSLIMGDGSNITFEPISPEVVAEDIIRSASWDIAGTGVNPANGHDYLYLFYRGKTMMVFDLQTRELVDVEDDCFNTPNNLYVDANGILWVCGANRWLYRYDPTTGESKNLDIPSDLFPNATSFNALGLTGDGNGKLYFGTYNTGYLGMYDTVTQEFSRISGWLDINDYDDSIADDVQVPDAMRVGQAGLIVKDGYIYATVDGNKNGDDVWTHAIIKYSIAEQKIVDHVDVSACYGSKEYLTYLKLAGDVLFLSSLSDQPEYCTVDISGEKMQRIDIDGIKEGYWGAVTEVIDGKAYIMGNDCALEFDVETRTVTPIPEWPYTQMRAQNDCVVTIEGDDRLPGQSIIGVRYDTQLGSAKVTFMNPQTKEIVLWEGLTIGMGSGNQLQTVIKDPSGEHVYTSAYGNNQVAEYDVATGEVKLTPTYGHQVDNMFWYNGNIYCGTYNTGTITRFNVETGVAEPLFNLVNSAFQQKRMHALTAGDNKVFAGPTPDSSMYGGVLVWYDLDQELTYVAAGPNPEDVYYADTSDMSVAHVWYSALTGEKADFDENDDGVDDSYITLDTDADSDGELDKAQRFNGVIANQTINCIVYKDGYIYGSTSKWGGSGTTIEEYDDCATLFVYDVAAMKVIGKYDLCDTIEGLKAPIEMIEVIAADPDVDGKFWGVVSDTLFSFTFDPETGFSVTEELSFGKQAYYTNATSWGHRRIVFDGDYMYVVFGGAGTYMINRNNLDEKYLLSLAALAKMVLAEDGNLYGFVQGDLDLSVLRVADITQPLVAESVQARIDALPETVTAEDDAVVAAVRKTYDALSDVAKELVDTTKLEAAEAALAPGHAAAVEVLINAIGTVTLESEKTIRTAREAYDALLDTEKALVSNVNVLTDAEASLAALKAAAEKEAADKAAAETVAKQIEAIGEVKLESEEAIKAARAAYEALTADQKKLVDTIKLTAAETKLDELKAAAEKEAADKAAAEAVTKQIDAIGTVTLNSEEAIKAARAAYEALTAAQKELVDAAKLTAAETKLAELKTAAEKAAADKAAADAVIAKIEAIGTVTKDSKTAIEAARAAYEALTADQKALVTNLNVLTAAEAALEALQKPAEPKPEEPKTGDTATVAVWAVILVASATALSVVLLSDTRRKHI